jgi:hypothetical protein
MVGHTGTCGAFAHKYAQTGRREWVGVWTRLGWTLVSTDGPYIAAEHRTTYIDRLVNKISP